MKSDESVLKECLNIAKENGFGAAITSSEIQYDAFTESLSVKLDGISVQISLDELLFNHEFCKALFSEEEFFIQATAVHSHIGTVLKMWEWHIQQLALSADRIMYLRKWLKG